jgi:LysR family transcriptional regulator, glycine cleavage system transcriptional activator
MTAPYALPPLNGLRAFEAVARHLSFQNAAEELFVTPGAISQQIKKLEEILQTSLFNRDSHGVSLTEAGLQLLPGLSAGFEQLDSAVQSLKRNTEAQHVTISSTPSFAAKWLVARLENWTALHPEIDVRMSASLNLANFGPDGIDIAVRFGSGNYDGLSSTLLLKESFVVVCSPIFVEGAHPITSPEALRDQTLIHVTGPSTSSQIGTDWREWLKSAGVNGIDVTRGLAIDDSGVAILAAIGGQGFLLARRTLVEADIAAGRLALPFDLDLPIEFSWHIVAPDDKLARPEVSAFKDWLLSEAHKDETLNEH